MSQELLYWQALNRAMDIEMAADESIFTLGEDVGLYGGSYRVTEGLHAKYGEWRVRDTPISENSFTGLGVGAALLGLRPVVEIMTIKLHAVGSRLDHQRRRQDTFHVGRTVQNATCCARARGRCSSARGATRPEAGAHLDERAGFTDRGSLHAARCLLAVASGDCK